jgi:hypothetical protein
LCDQDTVPFVTVLSGSGGAMARSSSALFPVGQVASTATRIRPLNVPTDAPDFAQRMTRLLLEGRGDELPVSD